MNFQMYIPTRTVFGAGQLNNLHTHRMPGRKALLVISNGQAVKRNGALLRTEEQLQKAGVAYVVFDKIESNPLKETVMQGGCLAREAGCDFIVALGGGSVIDAAKAIAVLAVNDGDLWDYIQSGSGGRKPFTKQPLPIIAIPTTAGTGSETDHGGVITNAATKEKTGILSESLFPVLAIIDPELMLTVPPQFTAFQGFDALFHSIEGYISNKANWLSDMLALTAIENISKHLATAVSENGNLAAREQVAFGSYVSGLQLCVGACTSQHSLEHAMSAYHQALPHGAGLIMLSKAYFGHFIEKHVCDDRFIRIAKAMGAEAATEPFDFIKALGKLQEECGVAELKMSDYGIKPEEFERFARNAMDTMGWLFTCDRASLNIDDCVAIFAKSYK